MSFKAGHCSPEAAATGGLCLPPKQTPRILVPTLANNPSLIAGAGWAWGGYVNFTPLPATDYVIHDVFFDVLLALPGGTANLSMDVEMEIESGPAGSEVFRGSMAGRASGQNAAPNTVVVVLTYQATRRFRPFKVPAGDNIRARATNSSTLNVRIGPVLGGYDPDNFPIAVAEIDSDAYLRGELPGATAQETVPAGGTVALTAGGVAWTYPAAFTTLLASAPSDILLQDLIQGGSIASRGAQYQVALGAAGSEVVVEEVAGSRIAAFLGPGPGPGNLWPTWVPAAERVSARMASSAAGAGVGVRLTYERLA